MIGKTGHNLIHKTIIKTILYAIGLELTRELLVFTYRRADCNPKTYVTVTLSGSKITKLTSIYKIFHVHTKEV